MAEDHPDARHLLADILGDAGYEVTEAKDGGLAFEKACNDNPDLILLDVSMPVMDGWEILEKPRENPGTRDTPVVMVTALRQSRGELAAWRLGVRHYIAKPFRTERVLLTVRVALREAEGASDESEAGGGGLGTPYGRWNRESAAGPDTRRRHSPRVADPDRGNAEVRQERSLSVYRPRIASGWTWRNLFRLRRCCRGPYPPDVIDRSGRVRLPTRGQASHLCVERTLPGRRSRLHLHPGPANEHVGPGDGRLSDEHPVIVVDSLTTLASESKDRSTLRFFSACRRLCDEGRTIIMAAQPHAFDERTLARLRDLCDTYVKLRVENLGTKRGTALEVTKADKVEMSNRNTISFEVLPGVGMQTLAFSKFRA